MNLRNKKTGEIIEFDAILPVKDVAGDNVAHLEYGSLAELNAEWEDVPEEPKEFYFIDQFMSVSKGVVDDVKYAGRHNAVNYAKKTSNNLKTAGNYFSSREEAELAVRKLKAWKRLKGGGFEFMSCSYGHDKTTDDTGGWIRFRVNHLYDDRYSCEVEKDLDLLFGGEE